MKRKETLRLLKYINFYYGRKMEIPIEEELLEMLILTWHEFLSGYEYSVVKTAVKKLMINKDWPPTPGEIIKEIEAFKLPLEEKLTPGEAWNLVLSLIRKYGISYNYKQVADALPVKVLDAVNCVGGLQVIGNSSENDTYLMNAFIKSYQDLNVREREEKMLPPSVREEVKLLTDHFKNNRLALLANEGEE